MVVGIDGTDARVSLDKKDNDVSDKERQREIGQQKEGRDSNADATHATKIRLASRLADYGRRREKDSAGANKGKLEKRKKTKKNTAFYSEIDVNIHPWQKHRQSHSG